MWPEPSRAERELEECAAILRQPSSGSSLGEGPEHDAEAQKAGRTPDRAETAQQLKRHPWRGPGASPVGLLATFLLAAACGTAVLLQWGPRLAPADGQAEPGARQGPMTARDVANALSAYAQLGREPADAQLDVLAARAEEVVGDMDAQDVARTLDAYAKLRRRPKSQLLSRLGARAREVVGDMDAQDVADTINAYAELGQGIGPQTLHP